jgi:hypothetical protein
MTILVLVLSKSSTMQYLMPNDFALQLRPEERRCPRSKSRRATSPNCNELTSPDIKGRSPQRQDYMHRIG